MLSLINQLIKTKISDSTTVFLDFRYVISLQKQKEGYLYSVTYHMVTQALFE